MSVQALGTKFNVSSYKNENNTSTVLVEGSIAVFKPEETYHKEKHLVIKPSQQAIFNNDLFTVKKVNIKKHIAWVNGELYFINDCFENIMKELERHYNIIIENRHKDLSNVRYTGTFDEKDTIEQVLNTFLRNTNFKYSYKNKRHIIIDPNLENSQGDKPTKNN
jgi:ferric-dicitrate binding protein FerR (iron transport regulator)